MSNRRKRRLGGKRLPWFDEWAELGYTLSPRGSGHLNIYAPDGSWVASASSTPSDHRAVKNVTADLRRHLRNEFIQLNIEGTTEEPALHVTKRGFVYAAVQKRVQAARWAAWADFIEEQHRPPTDAAKAILDATVDRLIRGYAVRGLFGELVTAHDHLLQDMFHQRLVDAETYL